MSKQARPIIEALGAEAIQSRIGVGEHMIRHAKSTGKFPSSWYDLIERMCVDAGIRCPRSAFKWKQPADSEKREDAA